MAKLNICGANSYALPALFRCTFDGNRLVLTNFSGKPSTSGTDVRAATVTRRYRTFADLSGECRLGLGPTSEQESRKAANTGTSRLVVRNLRLFDFFGRRLPTVVLV